MNASRLVRTRPRQTPIDLCTAFCSLYIAARGLSTSAAHHALGGSNNDTPNPMSSAPPGTTKRDGNTPRPQASPRVDALSSDPRSRRLPDHLKLTPEQRAAAAARKSKIQWEEHQKKMQQQARQQGGLANDSIFADDIEALTKETDDDAAAVAPAATGIVRTDIALARRSPINMSHRLDPKPSARARWMRMKVIQHVHRRGRLTREMRIARTERSHLSKSRFFKTSIKKLAPLARQIAGKSIDEAIMQMRFSSKKAAREVHKQLLLARNEAIVMRGMGLPDPDAPRHLLVKTREQPPAKSIKQVIRDAVEGKHAIQASTEVEEIDVVVSAATQSTPEQERSGPSISDPSCTVPLPTQLPSKALKRGVAPSSTDMYVAEAWVNRGPYGKEPSPRARGRQDVLRPPYTGISILLKEEKTRTREKQEKEIKAIRKRLNGKIWTQLPDRPVTRQSQYVLW